MHHSEIESGTRAQLVTSILTTVSYIDDGKISYIHLRGRFEVV